uniref:Phosphomevalonate kinase n=1 Tax=Dendroctonus armandi TaxID=77159 RepID=A0A481MT73_9CUCU|nr:phosphomevalonate kinase [Dendroctonus armandi]
MEKPQHILLFSGKRKSGKDFICEKLKSIIGEDNCCIVRISGPLKQLFAENHNLQINELMSDGPYKEQHRLNMITWSDEIRKKDPGYFCRAACKSAAAKKLWIVSDIRRKTDIKWFKENCSNLKLIRITAALTIRKERGWIFTAGVDDAESECDLDDFGSWDIELANNNREEYENAIRAILKLIS